MNIKEQEYMLELDKYKSITKAAEALNMTQPALSIFLSNLENRIGAPLFERAGKTLLPTQVGSAYLHRARTIATAKLDFEMERGDLIAGLRGELRIGGLKKGNLYIIPKVLRLISESYPNIKASVDSNSAVQLMQDLSIGKLDIIYINRALNFPGLKTEHVRKDHLLLALSPDHPACAHAVTLAGAPFPYMDLRFLGLSNFFLMGKNHSIRILADHAMEYAGLTEYQDCPIDTIDLGCQIAAEGLGAAFTMETYIRHFHYPHPLNFYLVGDPEQAVPWVLMWRESAVLTSYMKDFIRLIKQLA